MTAKTVKLSSKNQVVIPKEARERLGVAPGDELLVVAKEGTVILVPKPRNYAGALAGSGLGIYGDVNQYLKRERSSWTRKGSRKP